jgi:hypothetical protein
MKAKVEYIKMHVALPLFVWGKTTAAAINVWPAEEQECRDNAIVLQSSLNV